VIKVKPVVSANICDNLLIKLAATRQTHGSAGVSI
jgi:hypothetical protein